MTDTLRAPAEIAWLADLVGAAAALKLIELHGGTRLYIPSDPRPEQRLAEEIGLDAVRALARAYGGEAIKVPVCKWWRARVYRNRGDSYAAIARKLGCTETAVWRYVRPTATTEQLDLPLV